MSVNHAGHGKSVLVPDVEIHSHHSTRFPAEILQQTIHDVRDIFDGDHHEGGMEYMEMREGQAMVTGFLRVHGQDQASLGVVCTMPPATESFISTFKHTFKLVGLGLRVGMCPFTCSNSVTCTQC